MTLRRQHVDTPYGPPSDELATGALDGVEVVFLARHGSKHTIPPAQINYRANLWAMHKLGVTQLVAPTAAGSLQAAIRPGDFVVSDQFVDRTYGRADTFFTGPRVATSARPTRTVHACERWRSRPGASLA